MEVPKKRATVRRKLFGGFVGLALGMLFGVAGGRGMKPWQNVLLFGREVDSEFVAFVTLLGGLVGVVFTGGKVGRIGWATLAGTLVGVLVEPNFYEFGTLNRILGAMAGACQGFLFGVLWEGITAKFKNRGK